jgi:hypothetical protein
MLRATEKNCGMLPAKPTVLERAAMKMFPVARVARVEGPPPGLLLGHGCARGLADVMLDAGGFGPYPIVAAPGIPAERVKILREAYGQTLKTPEFLEEAKKNKWEIKPVGGDELEALAKEVVKPSTEVVERLKLLLGD